MSTCGPHECAYCQSPTGLGERWVREKIYEPTLVGQDVHYRGYHAEVFAAEELSCWEKHQLELEVLRTTPRAA